MDNRFTPLEGDEVLSVDESVQILIGHRTFRASELTQALQQYLLAQGAKGMGENDWFAAAGVSCEALRFGANRWLKGRVRISLEFCPDENAPDITPFSGAAAQATPLTPEISGSAFVEDGLAEGLTTADLPIAAAVPEPDLAFEAEDEGDEDSFFDGDEAEEPLVAAAAPDSLADDGALDDGALDDGALDDGDLDDVFGDAPTDLDAADLAAEDEAELSDPIAAMVDGLAEDDELETATEDIFADAPADPDDLFGDSAAEISEDNDPFGDTAGGDDDLSGLLDDADDVFADAPTEMPTAEDTGDDIFADAPTDLAGDTTTVAAEEDIFATDAEDDLFGESEAGELDLGEASSSDELAVEDAEDIFGESDDDDDAIDWGLDDGEGDELSLDGDGDDAEDDSVFADIWNDIDEMS
ncbi:MAG: KGK domain-containing protein [Spirulinaceae cyanobacterium]